MPSENGVMRGKLGGKEFTFFDLTPENTISSVWTRTLPQEDEPCTAQWLVALGVDILFVSKFGEHAQTVLKSHKIQIIDAEPGADINDLVKIFLR